MKPIHQILACFLLIWGCFNTTGCARSEGTAFDKAKTVITPEYQKHVLSIYGKGSPDKIDTWYFNFYDPNSERKGKTVVIQNDRVDRVHPSEGRGYDDAWSFDPALSKIDSEQALKTAHEYANQNQISYNSVNLLLKRPEVGKAPIWRVELINQGTSQGFVYSNPQDGKFVKYETPQEARRSEGGNFANDVERTFRGIGADLEEFFTGERTVDK